MQTSAVHKTAFRDKKNWQMQCELGWRPCCWKRSCLLGSRVWRRGRRPLLLLCWQSKLAPSPIAAARQTDWEPPFLCLGTSVAARPLRWLSLLVCGICCRSGVSSCQMATFDVQWKDPFFSWCHKWKDWLSTTLFAKVGNGHDFHNTRVLLSHHAVFIESHNFRSFSHELLLASDGHTYRTDRPTCCQIVTNNWVCLDIAIKKKSAETRSVLRRSLYGDRIMIPQPNGIFHPEQILLFAVPFSTLQRFVVGRYVGYLTETPVTWSLGSPKTDSDLFTKYLNGIGANFIALAPSDKHSTSLLKCQKGSTSWRTVSRSCRRRILRVSSGIVRDEAFIVLCFVNESSSCTHST